MTNSIFVRNYVNEGRDVIKFYVFDGDCVDLYIFNGEDYNHVGLTQIGISETEVITYNGARVLPSDVCFDNEYVPIRMYVDR